MPHAPVLPALSPPVRLLAVAALALPVLVTVAALAVGEALTAIVAALAVYAAGVALAVPAMSGYPHARLGLCNLVTLTRWALSAALVAPLLAPAAAWVVPVVAVLALALDGVDGWAARRAGLGSDFGARFDMEVDAALGLILTLNLWTAGIAGLWVLVLGVPRYLFIAAGWVWPWMTRPLPPRFTRKLACVVQVGGLILALLPPLHGMAAQLILSVAAALLLWSFARDTLWLFRARHDG